jgi:UDP-N-acetyl-D-glucosamine dehydrogenase
VPTPIDAHAVPDLRALRAACDTVVRHARVDQTIVLTSTTYVGSTEELLVEPLRRRGLFVGTDVHVAFSPERIDPGNTVNTQDVTPRVVGGVTPACTARAARVLGHVAPEVVAVSSAEAAEMTKLLENTFRAVNIAFANEIADVCGHHGIDVTEVIGAAATKPYGFMPFMPGPGVGGHCIPCDPHYLLWGLRPQRHRAPVTEQAMATLEARPLRVVERARAVLGQRGMALAGARVLVAGVAYKPDVADVRESPAAVVLDGLLDAGARTSYVDPLVERLDLPSGRQLRSLPSVDAEPVDLVVVHTLHAALPAYELLTHAPLVLDCTYRLPVGDHVFRP